ncbi:hypothetical protein BSKO_09859 [Bryopsis sp. KO-2023]|nr:hypothetical protein BSKO_09859 [Bryopsis sp. KO-2023]
MLAQGKRLCSSLTHITDASFRNILRFAGLNWNGGVPGGEGFGWLRVIQPTFSLSNFRAYAEEATVRIVPEGGKFTRLPRRGGRQLGDSKPRLSTAHRYKLVESFRNEVPCGEWGVFDLKERGELPWDKVGHVHACHKVESKVIVIFAPREEFGYPLFWEFDLDSGVWREIEQKGTPPAWVEYPCTFMYANRLWYLDYLKLKLPFVHLFNLKTQEWEEKKVEGDAPGGGRNREYVCVCSCYYKNSMYFYGGKPRDRSVHILDLRSLTWEKRKSIADPPNPVNTFSMCVHEKTLTVITQRKMKGKRDVSLFKMHLDTDDWVMDKRMVELGKVLRMPEPVLMGNKWYWLEGREELSVYEFDFDTLEPLEIFPCNRPLRGSRFTRACAIDTGILLLIGWSALRPPGGNLHTPADFFHRSPVVQALVFGKERRTQEAIKDGVFHDVSAFFDCPDTSDVVLKIRDTSVFAHRSILACRSPVFKEMLYENPTISKPSFSLEKPATVKKDNEKQKKRKGKTGKVEGGKLVVELDTHTHTPKAVLSVIKGIYGRLEEAPTVWNDLVDLLEAAGHYGVTGLGTLCSQAMERNLDKESLWEAIKFSQDLESTSLWIACRDYAELNWEEIKDAKNRRRLAAIDKELEMKFLEGLELPADPREEELGAIDLPAHSLIDRPVLIP